VAVVVVGLNHRIVPLPVLETMTVLPARLPKALRDLGGRDHLEEVVVLSTCMRTEIYAVASRFHGAVSDIRGFLTEWSNTPPEVFSDHLYAYYDDAAVNHLFQVAAGIDSAVLGEGEILGQVRQAWDGARTEGTAGPVLEVLFRSAVEAGKRVRSETAIARGTTSLSQAAVELAGARLGSLAGCPALVIGTGDMGEAVTRALAGAQASLLVANRTHTRAATVARAHRGRAVAWDALPEALASVEVVISSSGSSELLIAADDVADVMAARGGRPLLVIDIAVPRDVDPAVGHLPGVSLLDMDDLKAFVLAGMSERRKELPRAGEIIAEEVERYLGVAAEREVAPLVVALRQRAETLRQAELARASSRLAGLDERQAGAVDALTKGIVAKLLHDPTLAVKKTAGSPRGEQLAQALRQLFEL
jgi:glutamyl-tRNA reductase